MKRVLSLLPLCFTGIVAMQLSTSERLKSTHDNKRPAPNIYYANEGHCPDNWVAFGDNCYWFASNDSRMMYFQALRHCQTMDAHLVTVPTEKQQKFLVSRLSDATTNLWVGLERHPNGTWTWLDGNAVVYTNWIVGQPRPNGEECSEILTGTIHVGRWNQVRCNARRMHVCQKRRDKSLPAPTAAPKVSDCERAYPGSFEYRSSCYRMGSYQDWNSAASTCQGQGGHLVSIRDAFEDAFLSVKFNFQGGLFWTGLHDAKATGRFTWASGWPVHYTSWAPLQPTASVGSGSRCVASDLTTGLWSVQPCDSHLAFLCEFNTEDPPEVEHHEGSCPEHAKNWIDVGTPYCYWLETERVVSFNESDAICQTKNSTLASFHSKDQVHRLLPYIRKSEHQLWIGLVSAHNELFSSNGTRNVTRLLSFDSPALLQNVSFQNPVTEAQQLIKALPEQFTGKHPNNVAGRRHDDFGAAGPVVVMLGCLFLIFLAVGIPTFIQKKRREAKERRDAAMGLALPVPALDG